MDLKAKEEEKTKKKSFLGVLRKISFRTRKTSKEEPSSPPPAPASPPLLLEVPPPPLELAPPPTPPPSPVVTRTPVPSDSPLLQKAVPQVASHQSDFNDDNITLGSNTEENQKFQQVAEKSPKLQIDPSKVQISGKGDFP